MIYQQLLRRAVAGRPQALVDFVETIAPHLLERFTTIPALGGSGRLPSLDPRLPEGLSRFTEQELSRFSERNPDQSLTAHILNGLFSGLRMAERLPPEKALSDLEQRLWMLGYIVHDYTKVYGIKVLAGQLAIIREVIRCLGDDLSFDAYLPNWRDYLDDIVFLAQNTQKVEGANLNLRDFRLKTQSRRLDVLRFLSSYADVLVHIKSPSDVMLPEADGRNTAKNLSKTLDDLFGTGQAPRLAYHELSEVRGLLSNLIHNAVMAQLKKEGYEPYLFFPNGTVYLGDPSVEAKIETERLANVVWERVLGIIGDSETFGVGRKGTGFKTSPALYQLTGLAGVLGTGRRKAMGLTNSKATTRLYGFFTGESESDLDRRYGNDTEEMQREQERLVQERGLPSDIRVDRLGEFLTMVYRTVRDHFKGTPDVCSALLDILGLSGAVTPTEATQQKGGTYFGWFYAAASYIQAHSWLDNAGIDDVIKNVSEAMQAWVNEQGLKSKGGKAIDIAIKQYVLDQLEIDGQKIVAGGDHRVTFAQELDHYLTVKTKRKQSCSLCCSRFEATKQEDQEVPFGPQQYTNRHPLGWAQVKRGICPICRIELILRRIQQPGLDEDRRPIQLYLYPTYFFTLETERVAKSFLVEMADLNVFALRQNLRKQSFSLGAFLRFEGFLGDGSGPRRGIRIPAYREYEPAGLVFGSFTPLGQKPTDTDAWIIPALLAIGIPLLLDVKVVASSSFVPIFSSGADFRETAVLDGPHAFINHIWGRDRFRVDELEHSLHRLLNLYDLHLDVFGERRDPHWRLINQVTQDVVTDPCAVFAYYERKPRRERQDRQRRHLRGGQRRNSDGISQEDLEAYWRIYLALGGEENMGIFGQLVDAYAEFYRAPLNDPSGYAIVRPLDEAIQATVKSDPYTSHEDLTLLVVGPLSDVMERIWATQVDGYDPIVFAKGSPLKRDERRDLSRSKQEAFVQLFLDKLFAGYCNGDRATLQERQNRIRSAASFYYRKHYAKSTKKEDANG